MTLIAVKATADATTLNVSRGFDLSTNATQGALPVATPVTHEHSLLAAIEARLTEEMRGLTTALLTFSHNAQLISKELPDTAHFSQAVISIYSLFTLQFANALLKSSNTPVLFDDGAEYLRQLGLSMEDLFREIDLDGRRFLAVALIDQPTDQALRQCETTHSGTGGSADC